MQIGFIGRLDYQKGIDIILSATPELLQDDIQFVSDLIFWQWIIFCPCECKIILYLCKTIIACKICILSFGEFGKRIDEQIRHTIAQGISSIYQHCLHYLKGFSICLKATRVQIDQAITLLVLIFTSHDRSILKAMFQVLPGLTCHSTTELS